MFFKIKRIERFRILSIESVQFRTFTSYATAVVYVRYDIRIMQQDFFLTREVYLYPLKDEQVSIELL